MPTRAVCALALWSVVVAGAYAPSLSGGYVYEDAPGPAPDAFARQRFEPWTWGQVVAALPSQPARSLDRFLTQLTQRYAGSDPRVARGIGLALHLLNGWLLWLVARTVLAERGAVAAALVFLAHPLQTEAVAYMAGRPEALSALWVLLALLASRRSVALAGLCTALAITGKEIGVMAWGLVPLFAWGTGQRWSRAQIGLWAVAAAVCGACFLRGVVGADVALWAGPWYVAGQLAALGRLLLLWPEALVLPSLTIDHDWRWITKPMAAAAVLAWGLLWRARPIWRMAALWVLVAALPRLLLPLPDGQHERHLYAGSLAVSLALGSLVAPRAA